MEKKAIHFGTETRSKEAHSAFFDGVKDAFFYHLLSKQKGFQSRIFTPGDEAIDSTLIKRSLKEAASSGFPGKYFISLSVNSIVNKRAINWLGSTGLRKSFALERNSVMRWYDIKECLSYFSSGDDVFFLITDCEQYVDQSRQWAKSLKSLSNLVKAKAVVLSIGMSKDVPFNMGVSTLATDLDFVINSAKTISDMRVNLEVLYGNSTYIQPELICYNLSEANTTFFTTN